MTAQEMWAAYPGKKEGDTYEAWAYGSVPDELAALTLAGTKTATASAYEAYAVDDEPVPKPGDYSIILNTKNEAVCIIRTTRVRVLPFCRVDDEQAYKEGEGDRSLAYWRTVHEEVMRAYLPPMGLAFTQETPVVCEEFEKVYP